MRVIRRSIPVLLGAVFLLSAGPAHAFTLCVHHAGCKPADNRDTIQSAVNDAAANDSGTQVKDTILVGSGEFDGFTNAPNHPIDVQGAGPATVVRFPSDVGDGKTVVELGGVADSLSSVTVRLPAGATNTGVLRGTLDHVNVASAGPQTGSSKGVASGTFADGTIDIPGGTGASQTTALTRSLVSAHIGFTGVLVEDSILRISGTDGVGVDGFSTTVRHVDLLGDGSTGSTAVHASPGSDAVRSSFIRGFASNFVTDGGGMSGIDPASINVSYSGFDPAVPNHQTGLGGVNTTSPGHNVAADPAFVSPSDLHLRGVSPFVDAADPSAPGNNESTTDLDGHERTTDGKGSGSAIGDIGAFEYQRHPPVISAASVGASSTSVHVPLTFSGVATDVNDEAVTLTWDFGDGQTASGAEVTHAFDTAGLFTVRLTARDESGASASQDLSIEVVNHAPALALTAVPAAPRAGQTIAFHSGPSDPDGDAVTVVWSFGDGQQATGVDASHSYVTSGVRTVTVLATDSGGATTLQTLAVTVSPAVAALKCRVPKLKGLSLKRAKAKLKKAHCKVGKVTKPRRKRTKLVVRSQSRKAGKALARGTKVNLKLGPKKKRPHR